MPPPWWQWHYVSRCTSSVHTSYSCEHLEGISWNLDWLRDELPGCRWSKVKGEVHCDLMKCAFGHCRTTKFRQPSHQDKMLPVNNDMFTSVPVMGLVPLWHFSPLSWLQLCSSLAKQINKTWCEESTYIKQETTKLRPQIMTKTTCSLLYCVAFFTYLVLLMLFWKLQDKGLNGDECY